MPRDVKPTIQSLDPAQLDPTHAALPKDEQREAWWRGSEDKEAWRNGEDVEYAYEHMFTEGLNNRSRTDEQWARIAYYLASGVTVTEVARHFKLSRSTIWRALQRSPGLRRRIAAEREMLRRESDSRFVAMRHAVVEGLSRAINAGNIRAILWAAERLELGGPLLVAKECQPEPERRPIRRPVPRRPRPRLADMESPTASTPAAVVPPEPAAATPVSAAATPTVSTTITPPAAPATAEPPARPPRRPVPVRPAGVMHPSACRAVRPPVRLLVYRLRAMLQLTDHVDERLVPFPAGAEARLNPWLARTAGEELNIYRPATRPRY
jgi:predicted DNA-binding protein YlxM (UPF0122 family)